MGVGQAAEPQKQCTQDSWCCAMVAAAVGTVAVAWTQIIIIRKS